jgi:hypothetical protein
MVVNPFRPTVLLPFGFEGRYQPDEQRLVLAHEFSRVAQRDLQLSLVPELACLLFFFVPLVWWAKLNWFDQRELLCDARSIYALNATPQAYGSLLLKFVESNGRFGALSPAPVGFMSATPSYGQLTMRLFNLNRLNHPSTVNRRIGAAFLAAVCLLTLPWRVGAQPQMSQEMLRARTKALIQIRYVGLSFLTYNADHKNSFPRAESTAQAFALVTPDVDKLKKEKRNNPKDVKSNVLVFPYPKDLAQGPNGDIFKSANSIGGRILYNTALSGVLSYWLPSPSTTILVYDEKPWPNDRHLVGFADGHVKFVKGREWEQALTTLKPKFWLKWPYDARMTPRKSAVVPR